VGETITAEMFRDLTCVADEAGLLRFGAVRLDDPRLARSRAAFEAFISAGHQGEMQFLAHTKTMREDTNLLLPGAQSALVGVMAYAGEPHAIARYAQWADYHTIVHRRLEGVAARLRQLLPDVSAKICVDTKPIPERAFAMLAGIGFQGKNGCLIVPGLGSYVVIGTILTTGALAFDPVSKSRSRVSPSTTTPWDACGSCRACLDDCPTDAFAGPAMLDARKCISYLTIEHRGEIDEALAAQMGVRIAGCDVCQEVCPHNASPLLPTKTEARQRLPPVPGTRDRDLSLSAIAVVSNNQHKGFVRHSALNRIPRRALRRNALIALGNADGPLNAEEDRAVEIVAGEEDPELQALARRVIDRRS
jgi:epoxyqueuosine reductase